MSTREDPGLSQTTYVCHAENAMMLTMLTFQQPQRGHYFPRWDLGGQPEFDGVRSLVAAGYAYQLMTQALNYRYKICRYVMYNVCIYLCIESAYSYTCIHIFDFVQVYIFLQYRQRECMISLNGARKAGPQKLWGCGMWTGQAANFHWYVWLNKIEVAGEIERCMTEVVACEWICI